MRNTLVTVALLIISVAGVQAQESPRICKTERNAPPSNSYFWPPDSIVKVYFVRNMFTPEQRHTMSAAMIEWTEAASKVGANVKFVDAGESDSVTTCRNCLTVTRREVYKHDRKHYSFFYPLRQDERGLLVSAYIDFDFATTSHQALQGFMSHELGHGMGLWDCKNCGKKQTIMNGFPGINRDNGLIAPSDCDIAVVKEVYDFHRRSNSVAAAITTSSDGQ